MQAEQHEGGEALDELVVSEWRRGVSFFGTIEEALDAIAQGIESLVDGMLYFPGCSAGIAASPPRSSMLLRTASLSSALVTEHLFRIAVDLLHQGRKRGDIVCLPGVIATPIGRPSASVRALILVEKPPRERPSALRSAPFHRLHNDAHG